MPDTFASILAGSLRKEALVEDKAAEPHIPVEQGAAGHSPVSPDELLDYDDYAGYRRHIFNSVRDAVETFYPFGNDRYTVAVADVRYDDPEEYSKKEEKRALQQGESLARRLSGVLSVTDNETGEQVHKTGRRVLMKVPYFTSTGTFIREGTSYTVPRQMRFMPGIYAYRKRTGDPEVQFNAPVRNGPSFRMNMDPASGIFSLQIQGRKVPLYPLLKKAGVADEQIKAAWGRDVFQANAGARVHPYAVQWMKAAEQEMEERATDEQKAAPDWNPVRAWFQRVKLSPETTQRTMGTAYETVTPEAMVHASRRLLGLNRGKEQPDIRDSLAFQRIYDVGDFLAESVKNDQGGVFRRQLWKAVNRGGTLDRLPSSFMDRHVQHLFTETGLAGPSEEINPISLFDQNQRLIRLGEGAIGSVDQAPDTARDVQSSYLGFVDNIRTPESLKVGLDMYLARNTRKGPDNRMYSQFVDAVSGKPEWVDTATAASSVIAFPDHGYEDSPFIPALYKGRDIRMVERNKVDYQMASGDDMFSRVMSLVPAVNGVAGMRASMGSRFVGHAVPLENREAPLVQSAAADGKSYLRYLGEKAGAVFSDSPGTVEKVTDTEIRLRTPEGTRTFELYKDHPFARKTFLTNTPAVKPGQRIEPGQLLASSNYTDDNGYLALGRNATVAYMPYEGLPYEDAVVISKGFAEKLASRHMYPVKALNEEGLSFSRQKYKALFPSRFNREQLNTVDENGIVKPGTVVEEGDPLILASMERTGSSSGMGRHTHTDEAVVWRHSAPGTVKEVVPRKDGYALYVESVNPMEVADKLAIPWGSKGVVSEIIPDESMPRTKEGAPIDLVLSAQSITSRTNPSQIPAAILGKIADKRGKPYVIPAFYNGDFREFAQKEADKYGVETEEDLYNPESGRTIPNVLVGKTYVYKTQQMAEDKGKARSLGTYTWDDTPARGGPEGGKHIGPMFDQALLAHGASENIRDLHLIRGQRNDDFWRQVKMGKTPPVPRTPTVYNKFRALIRGAGISLKETEDADSIFAMTNEDAKKLTRNRKLDHAKTLTPDLTPIRGGLFDPAATASETTGDRFAYFELPEPVLNPVMEKPIRSLLGVTGKQLSQLTASGELAGRIKGINLHSIAAEAKNTIKQGSKSKRDAAVKRYGYAKALLDHNAHPSDFLMERVPVVPPRYRPIMQQGDMNIVSDLNRLYKQLHGAMEDFKDAREQAPDLADEARFNLYRTYKELTGLADPTQPELKEKKVGGILKQLFGKGSPKFSFVQRRVQGADADMAGLGVAIPDPSLKLNEIGLPLSKAWDLYQPFVIRRLVREGMSPTQAVKRVADKDPVARDALEEVSKERPVLVNRAPTLHKYSVMAFLPKLVQGEAVRTNVLINSPFNLDYDGNCVDYDTHVNIGLSREILDRYPSSAYADLYRQRQQEWRDSKLLKEADNPENASDVYFSMKIGEFPREGESIKDRNGADVYSVPEGVSVLGRNEDTGEPEYYPVLKFTVENDCLCSRVCFRNRELTVSSNESLAIFDHNTGQLEKLAPRDSLGRFCAILHRDPAPFPDEEEGDFEAGWQLGVSVSDGESSGDLKRAALRKRIPQWALTYKSRTFLLGLMSGLCDGVASVIKNTVQKASRYSIRMNTSSPGLKDDMARLFFRLGLRWSVTTTPARDQSEESYTIVPSAVDVQKILPELKCFNSDTLKLFEEWKRKEYSSTAVKGDVIPLTFEEAKALKQEAYKQKDSSAYATLDCKEGFPRAHRAVLRRVLDNIPGDGIPEEFEALSARVNAEVSWQTVKVVEDAGRRQVFDFEVDGPKVFSANFGVIVWDTMSYQVPVSKKAVKEAFEKMLPGKNLISGRTEKPHYVPRQEYLQGLWLASRPPAANEKARRFRSEEEAIAAFRQGSIRPDTPVTIGL